MRFDSINSRLMAVGMFFIVGTSLVMAIIGIGLTTSYLKTRTQKSFELMASYMARNVELGILLDDSGMLERAAKNILAQKDIKNVVIKSKSGKILLSLGKTGQGILTAEVEAPVQSIHLPTEGLMFSNNGGSQEIGKIIITYSQEELNRLRRTMAGRFILIAVVLSSIPIFVYWLLARSIISPLNDLLHVAKKVSAGEMDVRARGGKVLETRTLASAFNDMLRAIKRHQKELDKANAAMAKQHALAEVGKFSMMIAHEVKNPLAIIKGSMDILKKKDLPEGTRQKLGTYLEEEVARINTLMEDFLLFARPKKPDYQPVNMNTLLAGVAEKINFMEDGKGPEIFLAVEQKECVINSDPQLMERAFLNIFKNALDACKRGDSIEVQSFSDEKSWTCTIKDTGKGIPPDKLEQVFKPFFTSKAKGTGLGLAITKGIVDVHQGSLFARNRRSGGACFEVVLKRG